MKRKGFTLIELLAVIVVLAIIALIATPMVLNTIEEAKEGSAKTSAHNYIRALETSVASRMLKGDSMKSGLYILDASGNITSPITLEVSLKGTKADEGNICINNDGVVSAYSLKIGNYYVTSVDGSKQEMTDKLVEISCDSKTYQEYYTGTNDRVSIIYYNPETNMMCTESEAISITGTKTGCMRWYAIENSDSTKSTIDVILDHNTTVDVVWNSTGKTNEMKEVQEALQDDISAWNTEVKPTARIITAEEIANIIGLDIPSWSCLESNDNDVLAMCNASNRSGCKFSWLYDRISTDCTSIGCLNNSEIDTSGYWTSTVSSTDEYAWAILAVDKCSMLVDDNDISQELHGVRPVITISKNILS